MYVCMYVCMYECIYIYIYIHCSKFQFLDDDEQESDNDWSDDDAKKKKLPVSPPPVVPKKISILQDDIEEVEEDPLGLGITGKATKETSKTDLFSSLLPTRHDSSGMYMSFFFSRIIYE